MDDVITIIVVVIIAGGMVGFAWLVGINEQNTLKGALPPCNHATVGQEYGQYVCMGEYSYVRRATK